MSQQEDSRGEKGRIWRLTTIWKAFSEEGESGKQKVNNWKNKGKVAKKMKEMRAVYGTADGL